MEIRDMSLKYTGGTAHSGVPAKTKEENPVQTPTDQVTLSKPEKSIAKKIIEFPGRVLETVGGVAVGAVSTPLHIIPGVVKGVQEGLASEKGERTQGLMMGTLWVQNLALGAGAGFMVGGPIGAALGGGAAAVFTGLTHWMGDRAEVYDKMVERVENKVDKAIEDNVGNKNKVLVQNATEGSIIGGAAGARAGWDAGYEAGKGVVAGVMGGVEGVVGGVYEGIKEIIREYK